MKKTKRICFDIDLEDHTILKVECAKSHISLREVMRSMFFETVERVKKFGVEQVVQDLETHKIRNRNEMG